jgi:hypothetical protein
MPQGSAPLPSSSRDGRRSCENAPARPDPDFRRAAAGALAAALTAGVSVYDRNRFLARFHRLSPQSIKGETAEAAGAVLRELERALRGERARAGHWSYDLNRHIGLLAAFRAEKARFERIARGELC